MSSWIEEDAEDAGEPQQQLQQQPYQQQPYQQQQGRALIVYEDEVAHVRDARAGRSAIRVVRQSEAAPMDDSTAMAGRRVERRMKGRGFANDRYGDQREERYAGRAGQFESLDASDESGGVQKSIEGYIIIVTNLNPEVVEDDVHDAFADFGVVQQCVLNPDRRTGFAKGYALLQYSDANEARNAIESMNGTQLFDRTIRVGWAFVPAPSSSSSSSSSSYTRHGRRIDSRR